MRSFSSKLAWLIWDLIDFVAKHRPKSLPPTFSGLNQVIILKPDVIGDFILFTGVLRYLRLLYPKNEWEITLVLANETREVASYIKSSNSNEEPFDYLITVNRLLFRTQLIYRFRFLASLVTKRYDLVVNLVANYRHIDKMAYVIDAQKKIGVSDEYDSDKKFKKSVYSKLIICPNTWQLEIERNAFLIEQLGYTGTKDVLPKLSINEELLLDCSELLIEKDVMGKFVVICPSASANYRIWPLNKLSTVVDFIWDVYKMPCFICGAKDDKWMFDQIKAMVCSGRPINLFGATTLLQLAALISKASICISMDSGPAHISVAVNAPLVCIVGGGHYKKFFPYGNQDRFRVAKEELDCFYCNWHCKYNTPICVRDISVKTVTDEIKVLIG
jgi:ADP-heptose:LPS heptosyltransferase